MQFEKLIARFCSIPSDFTFDELRRLLEHFGFECRNKGATSGSKVMFYRETDGNIIMLHKPHPGNVVKQYTLRDAKKKLLESGDLNE